MSQVNDIEGAGEHWQSLFTILTELFINGLDHGVLGLNSSLKNSPKGFIQYFKERTQKLDKLGNSIANKPTDFISITLKYFPLNNGGKVLVRVKDSGKGFDTAHVIKNSLFLTIYFSPPYSFPFPPIKNSYITYFIITDI